MKKYFLVTLIFFLYTNVVFSSELKYHSGLIADDLRTNAKAVVRVDETTFEVFSIGHAKLRVKYAVTILQRSGDGFATFNAHYDKIRKISNVKIHIYDSNGNLIRKVKRLEIKDNSTTSGYTLFADNRVKYYKPNVSSYPYTIEYEYEIDYTGLLHYPQWQPIQSYHLSIENSSFKLIIPKKLSVRYNESNLNSEVVTRDNGKSNIYVWTDKNLGALKREPYSPYLYEFTPLVNIAPNDFEIEGFEGNMESWKNFGKWQHSLNKGLDEISEETKNELKELVADEVSDLVKARRIYEYMQQKTRYVSIQVGIGGWRPFSALTVDEFGYGDCKALSNYMYSLLKSVGINSLYAIVKSGNDRNMTVDFPRNQFNHVILCVPISNDTVWLECTSQNIPFGFLGDFTDDRDVLIVTEDGGEIAHTTLYKLEDNTQFRNAKVELDEVGKGKVTIKTSYSGLQYDNVRSLLNSSYEEQKKMLEESIDISSFTINEFSISQEKNRMPSAELNIDLLLIKYASRSGKRMFIPLNLMNKTSSIPEKLENRETEITLKFAFHDTDTISYELPPNFELEYKPENIELKTIFGEYSMTVSINDSHVLYVRTRKMNKGVFPSTKYDELIAFYKAIVKADKAKLVLKRIE